MFVILAPLFLNYVIVFLDQRTRDFVVLLGTLFFVIIIEGKLVFNDILGGHVHVEFGLVVHRDES